MAMTAAGNDLVETPAMCWCCGNRTVGTSVVRLHSHPEVGVCFRCIRWLEQQKHTIERRTGQASWWHQLQYRALKRYHQIGKGRPGDK
jgi:hypothetical protein